MFGTGSSSSPAVTIPSSSLPPLSPPAESHASPPLSPRQRQHQHHHLRHLHLHHPAARSPRSHHPRDRGSRSPSFPASPLMSDSPTAKNYHASSFSAAQTSPAQTSSLATSPPSSFPMSTQQPNATPTTNSFPTPASSVSGQMVNAVPEDDSGNGSGGASSVVKQVEEEGTSRGNGLDSMDIDSSAVTEEVAKRPSDAPQDQHAMEVDVKDEQTDAATESKPDGDPSIASLQTDMGQAFHLCKTSYSISGPDPHWDLVSLYGLGPVAASVARTDPVTGEKINRLRKSYEGKIKQLGLAGRNKPLKHEPGAPGGLRSLTLWPEEEWYNQKVYGKEIKVPEEDSPTHRLWMKAMKFEPGPVPNNDFWEDVLGHEKSVKQSAAPAEPSKKPIAAPTPAFRQPATANGTPAASTPRPADSGRPKRAGKKRSYTDDSFVGYGDGFPEDDDLEGSLYSSGDAGSSKKKRRKDHVSGVPSSFGDRGGSYGVGMFGVGAR